MKADHGATPIPLPTIVDDPRWIGRFSREVRKSIAALRDRKVIVRGRQGRGGGQITLPWQVTLNEDGDAVVGAGKVSAAKTVLNDSLRGVMIGASYEGGTITAGEGGWIYAVVSLYSEDTYQEYDPVPGDDFNYAVRPKFPGSLSVVFSTIAPDALTDTEIDENKLWIPIAEIQEDEDENLSVDQHVFDNIRFTMELGEITP